MTYLRNRSARDLRYSLSPCDDYLCVIGRKSYSCWRNMFEYYCAQGLYTSDRGTKIKKFSTSLDTEERIDK